MISMLHTPLYELSGTCFQPVLISYSLELKWEDFNLCCVRFCTCNVIGQVCEEVYLLVLNLVTRYKA